MRQRACVSVCLSTVESWLSGIEQVTEVSHGGTMIRDLLWPRGPYSESNNLHWLCWFAMTMIRGLLWPRSPQSESNNLHWLCWFAMTMIRGLLWPRSPQSESNNLHWLCWFAMTMIRGLLWPRSPQSELNNLHWLCWFAMTMIRGLLWPRSPQSESNSCTDCVDVQTSRIIAKLACWSKELMDVRDRQFYLNWLKDQLKVPVSFNWWLVTTTRLVAGSVNKCSGLNHSHNLHLLLFAYINGLVACMSGLGQ